MASLFPTHGLTKPTSPAVERVEGAWHVYPLEGALELLYHNAAGNPSIRRIIARELKVGPGKTLLGGIDMADDSYRGFRADRIDRIVDAETGRVIDRNILDWLIQRAEAQEKERRRESRRELMQAKREAQAAKEQKSDG